MSWLSAALKRNKLDVLNKIAKPVQAVVNPMLDKLPGIGSVKAGAEAIGQLIPEVGGAGTDALTSTLPGIMSAAGNFLTGNNGLNALGAAQGLNAALLQQKALQYAKDAEGTAMGHWNANAPLREAGRAGVLNPKSSVDVSALPGIRRAGNPFAR
jgi:hypothetical protein